LVPSITASPLPSGNSATIISNSSDTRLDVAQPVGISCSLTTKIVILGSHFWSIPRINDTGWKQ
jgi:hypothetical protein